MLSDHNLIKCHLLKYKSQTNKRIVTIKKKFARIQKNLLRPTSLSSKTVYFPVVNSLIIGFKVHGYEAVIFHY